MKNLNDMTKRELESYLSNITIDRFPKGNSKFKCKKHNRILPYSDIVSGCSWCIMDEAMEKQQSPEEE